MTPAETESTTVTDRADAEVTLRGSFIDVTRVRLDQRPLSPALQEKSFIK